MRRTVLREAYPAASRGDVLAGGFIFRGKMLLQPLLDVVEHPIVLRFVEHLVVKPLVNDEPLVG